MPQFKKRHYQAIATAMQAARRDPCARTSAHSEAFNIATNELADLFARDNPAFKAALFRAACEPGSNVRARTVEGATGPLTVRLAALREAAE
jgi:hypothetical protein